MISEREAAKYPFLKDAVRLVDVLELSINDLLDPFYDKAIKRAEERIIQAILKGRTAVDLSDSIIELLSFPIANIFVNYLGENFLNRRYALAESVRAYFLLREEDKTKIAKIARLEFKWNLQITNKSIDGRLYVFEIYFTDFLRNAAKFRDFKWKLSNRLMKNGYVFLTKIETTRLLQEEINRKIEATVSRRRKLELPNSLRDKMGKVREIYDENKSNLTGRAIPSEVDAEAFPNCIKSAYEGLITGRRAGHMERFALTSFLVNIGMDVDEIVKNFVSITDFDEQFTRYQIEHIAGLRGSRIKYTPPTCSTLKTHRICTKPDNLCSRIRHPLAYYRIKLQELEKKKASQANSK